MQVTFFNILRHALFIIFSALAFTFTTQAAEDEDTSPLTINWYHDQDYFQPIIDAFTAETGIPVEMTSDYDTFTTDVLLVADFKILYESKIMKKYIKMDDEFWAEMSEIVPGKWRDLDTDKRWLGYAIRTRTAITNKNNVSESEQPRTYMDLADPKWKGRMTMRSARNVYNRSMVAYMIAKYGEEKAKAWVEGIVANVGDREYKNDVMGSFAIAQGEFDIGAFNSYYLGYMHDWWAEDEEDHEELRQIKENIRVTWLDGADGVFGNVTGIGISAGVDTRSQKYKDAKTLIRFLLSKKGQEMMSEHVFKYPVNAEAELSDYMKSLGTFKMDDFNLHELSYHYGTADRLMKEAGWESGWKGVW